MKSKIFGLLGIRENNRLDVLDGIRGVAVLMVFLYHIWGSSGALKLKAFGLDATGLLMWGHPGVDLFYVLSGFLLFKPFCEEYYKGSKGMDIKKYFTKRALRILPVYYIFIFLTVVLINQNYISKVGLKTLLINIFFLQNVFVNSVPLMNGVTWTLAVEVQFYILLPIMAKLFYGKRNKISFPLSILFVLAYRIILFVIMKPHLTGISLTYYYASEYNILGCFDNFAIGMTIANIYLYYKYNSEKEYSKLIKISKYIIWILPICFILLTTNYYEWLFQQSVFNTIFFSVFFDIGTYIVFTFIFLNVLFYESKLKKVLSCSLLRFFGIIGYSMYIWHLPIVNSFVNNNFVSKSLGWNKYFHLLFLSAITVIPFSIGMYIFVEKYFIDVSSRISLNKNKNRPLTKEISNSD